MRDKSSLQWLPRVARMAPCIEEKKPIFGDSRARAPSLLKRIAVGALAGTDLATWVHWRCGLKQAPPGSGLLPHSLGLGFSMTAGASLN